MDVLAHIPGYVSVLESKDRGRGLSTALDSITPALEVGPQLRSARRIVTNASATVLFGSFTTPQIVVPNGEIWHITHLRAGMTKSAAGLNSYVSRWGILLWPNCEVSGSGNSFVDLIPPQAGILDLTTLPAGTIGIAIGGPCDAWAGPGSTILTSGEADSSGPGVDHSITMTVLAERFRV